MATVKPVFFNGYKTSFFPYPTAGSFGHEFNKNGLFCIYLMNTARGTNTGTLLTTIDMVSFSNFTIGIAHGLNGTYAIGDRASFNVTLTDMPSNIKYSGYSMYAFDNTVPNTEAITITASEDGITLTLADNAKAMDMVTSGYPTKMVNGFGDKVGLVFKWIY